MVQKQDKFTEIEAYKISLQVVKKIIDKIYHNRFFSWLFPTTIYCLRKNLRDCESVLDLGCGPSSPLQYCKNIKYSIGVEAFRPYLEESKKRKIHSEYVEQKIETIDFPENSFDAVILIEVLEHLPKKDGYDILEKAGKWARKKVVVTTPNGYIEQKALDGNPMQKHLSGWNLKKMEGLRFHCRGLAGLKFLRREVPDNLTEDDLTAAIKYRPKLFWFAIATLSQLLTYYIPNLAFELFCVKKKKIQISPIK